MPRRRKPPAPFVLSAEIGNVDESTVAVTFDQFVVSSDYLNGVTIKVNGSPVSIDTAERQSNHALVYYVLNSPVEFGDVVVWEYLDGLIAAEDDGVQLHGTVQPVTNNVEEEASDPIGDALRAKLSAYYKLEDLIDSKNGLTLTNNNSCTFVAGIVNNAVQCAASGNKYLSRASNALLEGDDSFTLFCWVKFPSFAETTMAVASKDGNCNGGYYIYAFGPDPLVNLYFTIPDGDFGAPVVQADGVNLVANTFYFVAARYDAVGLTMNLRVNSTNKQRTGLAGDNPGTSEPFTIGATFCSGTGTNYADVIVDELGFCKGFVLSTEELDYLYNGGAGRSLFP